jgi:6-O-methylguanine DNA methyltransferase, DNA binding domain
VIPCHRVLGRNGLGGYSGGTGLATKRLLLELERAEPRSLSCVVSDGGRKTALPAPSVI